MKMSKQERAVRDDAAHLAMTVRRRGNKLTLWERYDEKRRLGTYRSFKAVERGITEHGAEWLAAQGRSIRRLMSAA